MGVQTEGPLQQTTALVGLRGFAFGLLDEAVELLEIDAGLPGEAEPDVGAVALQLDVQAGVGLREALEALLEVAQVDGEEGAGLGVGVLRPEGGDELGTGGGVMGLEEQIVKEGKGSGVAEVSAFAACLGRVAFVKHPNAHEQHPHRLLKLCYS